MWDTETIGHEQHRDNNEHLQLTLERRTRRQCRVTYIGPAA